MIREITKNDKDIFLELCNEFYDSNAVLHKIPQNYMLNTFNEAVNSDTYVKIYIIMHNEMVAGYSMISKTFSGEVGGIAIWLEELYIKESFRGLGLGKEFLCFLESTYEKTTNRFRLEIEKDNTFAKKIYEKQGYKELLYVQMIKDVNN